MGKQRRKRKKLHIESKNKTKNEHNEAAMDTSDLLPLEVPSNPFQGLNIDLGCLNKNIPDDLRSVKSFKSIKSEIGTLSKKDKLKLRKKVLLQKIDTVNQMRKESKIREKRKNLAVIGDANTLYDALPSLSSLLKKKDEVPKNTTEIYKKKGIKKANARKRELTEGMQVFKMLLSNKKLQKNPLDLIVEQVKSVAVVDRLKVKNK